MALALGEVESARLYESLYAKGRKYTEQHLFNGQYFVQNIDINDRSILQPYEEEGSPTGGSTVETYWNTETKEIKYQIGKGCHIDQVLAQWMADLCGIGDIVSRDMVVSALRSIYRNYFLESFRAHFSGPVGLAVRRQSGFGSAWGHPCGWPHHPLKRQFLHRDVGKQHI